MLFEVSSTIPMRNGEEIGRLAERGYFLAHAVIKNLEKSSLFKSVTSFPFLVATLQSTSTRLTLRTIVPCGLASGEACCCARTAATAPSKMQNPMR